jgi:hypothetical protein
MDAIANLEVNVFGGAFGINAFVSVELGGDGGKNALPARIGHVGLLKNRKNELAFAADAGYYKYIYLIFEIFCQGIKQLACQVNV